MSNGVVAEEMSSLQTLIFWFPSRGLRHIAVHCKNIDHDS